MNTIVMRAVFRSEPPHEARLEVENRIEGIVKMFAPQSKPEISSGGGCFWIAVEAVSTAVVGWLAIQTAGWAFQRYLLDGPVLRALHRTKEDDGSTEQQSRAEPANDHNPNVQLMPARTSPLDAVDERALESIIGFLEFAKPAGLREFTLKELNTDVDSGTGVLGKICRLSLSNDGKWSAEFIQVDTRDDFYAS